MSSESKPSIRLSLKTPIPIGVCDWNVAHDETRIVDQFSNPYEGKKKPARLNSLLCNDCRIELLKIRGLQNPK